MRKNDRRWAGAAIAAIPLYIAFSFFAAPSASHSAGGGLQAAQALAATSTSGAATIDAAAPTPTATPTLAAIPTAPPSASGSVIRVVPLPSTPTPAPITTHSQNSAAPPAATTTTTLTGIITTPSPGSALLATPAPTPCTSPTPLLGLGCPTPTAALPVPTTPTPTPTPTPAQSGNNSNAGGQAPPAAPPSGPSSPSSSAGGLGQTVIPGTLVVGDPLLASQLAAVLQNPVSAQRPDLLHFRPAAASTGGSPSGGAPTAGGDTSGGAGGVLPAVLAAMGALLVAAAVLRMIRQRGLRLQWRIAVAAIPAMVAVPVGAAASVAFTATHSMPAASATQSTVATITAVQMLSAEHARATALPPASVNKQWTSLVSIETSVTGQHDRLVSDEQEITALTQQLQTAQSPDPSTTGPQGNLRPTAVAQIKTTLQELVADHQQVLQSYNTSLQDEYTFFVNAAQSPQSTTALQTVLAHTPPEVQQAVTTDLNLVATQLQQEQQIQQASAADQSLPALLSGTSLTFHAPLNGVVSQGFGPSQYSMEPPVTYGGVFYPHFHTGLDIAAPLDTPVGAAAAGTVIFAGQSVDSNGNLVGYGNYIVIAHGGGFETLYGHLDKLLVKTGDTVQQGQVIALEGSTGWSTGPHVHFEIRKDGIYTDPAPYLAQQLQR